MSFPNGLENNGSGSIETPEDKSAAALKRLEEDRKRDQEAAIEQHKMSVDPSTLNNSSSPTETPTESPGESLNRFFMMHSTTDANPDYSSSSESSDSEPSSTSSSAEVVSLNLSQDREREMTLMVHFSTFGKPDHAIKSALWALRQLSVSGINVVQAVCGMGADGVVEFEPNDEQIGTWQVIGGKVSDPYKP
jgi:hypothetical protein